jgi:tetratricopeptide (TPR) repeat protein
LNNRAARILSDNPRAADDDSARAVKLCPRDETLRGNRANLLYKRATDEDLKTSHGRERAREFLLAGVKLHDNASAHALLAEIYYADDQPAEAAEHLRTAAKLSPDDARIANRLEDIERKADVESSFKDERHTHFVALFDGYGQQRLAWSALDMLEQAYFSVGGQLDLFPKERVTVVIYTGDQYKRAVNLPDWSTGAFDGKIRINEGQLQQDTGTLKSILRHEFTHAALSTLNRPLPAWLNEGLAEFFEGSDPVRAINMSATAKRDGKLVPFEDLERASFVHIADTDQAQLAYAESLSMIHRLVDKRGMYALQGFISRLENGEDLQGAFMSAYAVTPARHFEEWVADLPP